MGNEVYTDLEKTPEPRLCDKYNHSEIYNYVFHFNAHRQKWYGVHRDMYITYWQDSSVAIEGNTVGEVIKKITLDGPSDL